MLYKNILKHAIDFAVSALAVFLLSPIIVLAAVSVKLSSKGPAFFVQRRMGKNGKPFSLYKFRSMTVDLPAQSTGFEPGSTKRITPIGAFLRKTKIDELPQLFNVLAGDMSLVGPRPEVEKYVALFPERWKKILSVRPGITDNASILFRNEEEILSKSTDPHQTYLEEIMPKKLELYETYLDNVSFLGDMGIIARTVSTLIFRQG